MLLRWIVPLFLISACSFVEEAAPPEPVDIPDFETRARQLPDTTIPLLEDSYDGVAERLANLSMLGYQNSVLHGIRATVFEIDLATSSLKSWGARYRAAHQFVQELHPHQSEEQHHRFATEMARRDPIAFEVYRRTMGLSEEISGFSYTMAEAQTLAQGLIEQENPDEAFARLRQALSFVEENFWLATAWDFQRANPWQVASLLDEVLSQKEDGDIYLALYQEAFLFARDIRGLNYCQANNVNPCHQLNFFEKEADLARSWQSIIEFSESFAQAKLVVPWHVYRDAYLFAQHERRLTPDSIRHEFATIIQSQGFGFLEDYKAAYQIALEVRKLDSDEKRHSFAMEVAQSKRHEEISQ